jgi:hypothetical protein
MRPRACFVVLSLFVLTIVPHVLSATAEVLSAGTPLNVRTTQPIDADSARVGMRLDAIVDDPVSTAGRILVPRGALARLEVVSVERSSNLKGRDRITFRIDSLQIGGRTYPVATSYVEVKGRSEGKRATQKIIGGAGIGAAVGGLLGGGSGALWGATAGGTTGAIIAGSGKTHLSVPAETRLHFRLNAATRIES